MENVKTDAKNRCLLVPLTDLEKRLFDIKRKSEGKTAQGCMRNLILEYIRGANDKRSDG